MSVRPVWVADEALSVPDCDAPVRALDVTVTSTLTVTTAPGASTGVVNVPAVIAAVTSPPAALV